MVPKKKTKWGSVVPLLLREVGEVLEDHRAEGVAPEISEAEVGRLQTSVDLEGEEEEDSAIIEGSEIIEDSKEGKVGLIPMTRVSKKTTKVILVAEEDSKTEIKEEDFRIEISKISEIDRLMIKET